MPKQDELVGLYGEKSRPRACDRRYENYLATELVDITCFWAWAQEIRGSKAAMFNFGNGIRGWILQTDNNGARAIPVRSGKPDNP
ncbi:MAG: hypothetical protein JXB42_13640 [Deltaproteobacteria bacterium]|nr:hypothetical protein [Deltaproteobacteria bacterium]